MTNRNPLVSVGILDMPILFVRSLDKNIVCRIKTREISMLIEDYLKITTEPKIGRETVATYFIVLSERSKKSTDSCISSNYYLRSNSTNKTEKKRKKKFEKKKLKTLEIYFVVPSKRSKRSTNPRISNNHYPQPNQPKKNQTKPKKNTPKKILKVPRYVTAMIEMRFQYT